jgi:hypothetical protein
VRGDGTAHLAHTGAMSGDDEIERLLREVDAMSSGTSKAPAPRRPDSAAAEQSAGLSPVGTGLVAGVVCGVGVGTVTFLLSWLPLIDNPVSSAGGAFVGAFLTGTVLSWRRRRR